MDDLLCKEPAADSDAAVLDTFRRSRTEQPVIPDLSRMEDIPEPAKPPLLPTNVKDTGLKPRFINTLLLKALYMLGLETNVELAEHLKLSRALVDHLLGALKQQGFVEVRGAVPECVSVMRYGLTNAGKNFAIDACQQCEYVGPAPVSLTAFHAQVQMQSINGERISLEDLSAGLSHLILPERLIRRLGPAVNSARAMLIYGPPGNGKTSISEAIGKIFKHPIYVPHCFEVEGQVIRVFDPTVHTEISPPKPASRNDGEAMNLLRKIPDPRWVKCRRPVIIMGGELTIETLDLQYDLTSKLYEAPPQIKALGGVCVIDDFGRQRIKPTELLNRWIVPLEKRVDYMTLHTGKRFELPFDELVIFSTNIPPLKLMDSAQLRRIKHKLRIEIPSVVDYATIFRRAAAEHGLELPDSILKFMLEDFYPKSRIDFAGYHPVFIIEHAIAACRYRGVTPHISLELVKDALEDLFVKDDPEPNASLLALAHNKVS